MKTRYLLFLLVGQSLVAIESSWPVPDMINWETEGGVVLLEELNQLILRYDQPGTYLIRLQSSYANCMSIVEKEIHVVSDASDLDTISSTPGGIRSAMLYPNPNRGEFDLKISLTAPTDIQLRIYDQNGTLKYSSFTEDTELLQEHLVLDQPVPGIYTLFIQTSLGWRSMHFVVSHS